VDPVRMLFLCFASTKELLSGHPLGSGLQLITKLGSTSALH
jgi:hypothetical protein